MISTSPGGLLFLLLAGLVAGGVNAVAGGGSLLVFPALLAVGLPPLTANVTNSVAQWPGYVGNVAGNRAELRDQRRRILMTSAVAVVGSAIGCFLLLTLPGAVFDAVVPILVLLASALMAVSPQLKRWIGAPGAGADALPPAEAHDKTADALPPAEAHDKTADALPPAEAQNGAPRDRVAVLLPAVFLAAVYGGYFGGALGVILIATLSLCAHDTLVRLNALKGLLSLVVASVTVVVFSIGAPVDWFAVALLAPTTLVGGFLGAKIARRLPENVLRWSVVVLGFAVGVYLLLT